VTQLTIRTREGALDTDGPLDLSQAKASGFLVAGLYLNGNLNPRIADQATQLDMGLLSLWEQQPDNPLLGEPQGRIDAINACDLALAVRQPKFTPIFMPNDEEVPGWPDSWQAAATIAYFQNAARWILSRLYIPGFYGQTAVWDVLQQVTGGHYQCFMKAPDGTDDTTGANIVQSVEASRAVGGAWCDIDEVLTPERFGAWNYDGDWWFK
jgi:hypothetical protein